MEEANLETPFSLSSITVGNAAQNSSFWRTFLAHHGLRFRKYARRSTTLQSQSKSIPSTTTSPKPDNVAIYLLLTAVSFQVPKK